MRSKRVWLIVLQVFTALALIATGGSVASRVSAAAAKDKAADLSAVGPVIDVWYGPIQAVGALGEPQPAFNLIGRVTDADGDLDTLVYSLNGGPPASLTIGPDGKRLADPGDFNAEIAHADLLVGANAVMITAIDQMGNTMTFPVTLNYAGETYWPIPYQIDWQSAAEISDVATVVDGAWSLVADGVRTDEVGYDRLIALGDVNWMDYEVTVPFTVHAPLREVAGVGVVLRWQGHFQVGTEQPFVGWQELGAYGHVELQAGQASDQLEILFNGGDAISTPLPFAFVEESSYIIKMRVETEGSAGRYKLKVWPAGQPEPASWDLDGLDNSQVFPDLTSGSMLLLAHNLDITFGDVEVTRLNEVYNLSTAAAGSGQVLASPNLPAYNPNQQVTLTAIPDPGWAFQGWSGDITGDTNPINITMSGDRSVTATFTLVVNPDFDVYLPMTHKTDTNAQTARGSGQPTGLQRHTQWALAPQALSPILDRPVPVPMTEGTNAFPAPVSDDFNTCSLDPGLWTYVDPLGDTAMSLTGTNTPDAWLEIDIPGGIKHTLSDTNTNAPRLMQAIDNGDFEVEVKFESGVTQTFQLQGLLIEETPDTRFLRFEFHASGASTRIYAASFDAPDLTNLINLNIGITNTAPLYMRVARQGNVYTQTYSFDGQVWQLAGSFTDTLTTSAVGVFAGNTGNDPPHTAQIDYFFNTASPIIPEDGATTNTLTVNVVGNGVVNKDPDLPGYGCNQVVTLTGVADPGWYFKGWSGDITGSANPVTTTMNVNKIVTATFALLPDPSFDLFLPLIRKADATAQATQLSLSKFRVRVFEGQVSYGKPSQSIVSQEPA